MKLILIIAAVFISTTAFAQVYKFRAAGFAYVKTNNQQLHNVPWSPTDVLIMLDYDKHKIAFFNQDKDRFDMVTDVDKKIGEKTSVWEFSCLDKDNISCNVSFMWSKDDNHEWSVIVEYSNTEYIYEMDKIED